VASNSGDGRPDRDERSGVHRFLGGLADGGSRGDGGAQHVARRQLRDAELGHDVGGVRAFAGAGRAEQNQVLGPSI